MNAHQKTLLKFLTVCSAFTSTRPGFAYKSPHHFVAQHGAWYEFQPLPRTIRRGAPRICFANAIMTAVKHGLRYVEGYALSPVGILPIHHGWVASRTPGRLYEVTWPTPGLAYFGVEFSIGRADNCSWEGDASVLDDWHRHWPLLREPWTGEDWGRKWEPSEALQLAYRLKAANVLK